MNLYDTRYPVGFEQTKSRLLLYKLNLYCYDTALKVVDQVRGPHNIIITLFKLYILPCLKNQLLFFYCIMPLLLS